MLKKIKHFFFTPKSPKEVLSAGNFSSLAPGVFWKDLNGVYQGYNQELLKFLGLKSHKDIIGKTDYELPWTLDQANTLVENDQHVIVTCRAARFEETVRDFAGNEKVFMVIKVPMRDADGKVVGMVGTASDITEIKAAQEKSKKEMADIKSEKSNTEAMLNIIIDSVARMHWWKDISGIYRGCNESMVSLLGLKSKSDIIGKTDNQLPWYKTAQKRIQNDQAAMTSGQTKSYEEEHLETPGGAFRTFRITSTPLRDAKGNLIGTVGNAIEITLPTET